MLKQISVREFVAAAAGARRFRAKVIPVGAVTPEHDPGASQSLTLLSLADDRDTFILHNRFVSGDEWSEELGDYTDPLWETVTLRSGPELFESTAPGLEWLGGSFAWNNGLELLMHGGTPATFAVGGALTYAFSPDGSPYEFLVELELTGPAGAWRLKRSMGPAVFRLVRGANTDLGFSA